VQFPVARTNKPPVGTRLYREEGGFRIVILAQNGAGLEDVLTWADGLAALFRDVKFDGVECQVPGSPFLDDSNDDGLYFKASIVCPYTYHFTG
jgi:hypothetical protein